MWVRCVLRGTSIELGLVLLSLTILSRTSRSWCYPTTSASVFFSFFSPAPPSHSISCPQILLNTCPYHFYLLSCTFSHLLCPCNYFIPYSVQLGDPTHPSQHPHFRHIQLLLLCFLHLSPCLGTVHHCRSCILSLDSQAYSSVTISNINNVGN